MSMLDCIIVDEHKAESISIHNSSDNIKMIINGQISIYQMHNNVIIIHNEDAISANLPPNILGSYGKLILCKVQADTFVSLTQSEQLQMMQTLLEES